MNSPFLPHPWPASMQPLSVQKFPHWDGELKGRRDGLKSQYRYVLKGIDVMVINASAKPLDKQINKDKNRNSP